MFFEQLLNVEISDSNSNKFLPTQRDLKGLEAHIHSSRQNLITYISAYIFVVKVLMKEHGYSR